MVEKARPVKASHTHLEQREALHAEHADNNGNDCCAAHKPFRAGQGWDLCLALVGYTPYTYWAAAPLRGDAIWLRNY